MTETIVERIAGIANGDVEIYVNGFLVESFSVAELIAELAGAEIGRRLHGKVFALPEDATPEYFAGYKAGLAAAIRAAGEGEEDNLATNRAELAVIESNLKHVQELITRFLEQPADRTLHTDRAGRRWHVLERGDGTVSIYYTRDGKTTHYVVYDDMDHA